MSSKLCYTIDEAAEAIGVGRTSVYRFARAGELQLSKLEGRTLVTRRALEEFLERKIVPIPAS